MGGRFAAQAQRVVPALVLGVSVLGFWELVTRLLDVAEYILPRPSLVLYYSAQNFKEFLPHFLMTGVEAATGLAVGIIVGFVLSMVSALNESAERAILPWAIAVKAIPVVAIAPLLILWFGYGLLSKIVMSAIVCFFPVFVSTLRGLKSYSEETGYLFRSYGATRWQFLMKLQIPFALPYFFASVRVASTLSVIGAIVAELAGAKTGLGFLVLYTSIRVETVRLFGAILFASVLGFLLYGLVALVDRITLRLLKMEPVLE